MKISCIVQARMTSSRLPGKVLRVLDHKTGMTILGSVVERLRAAKSIDEIVIAMTVNSQDDPLQDFAEKEGLLFYRGSENDVLDRYYHAAEKYGADHIIRITSDCPFIDPHVIDELIKLYLDGEYQYASNCIHRTYPHGLDCEVFTREVLQWMHEHTTEKYYREHVTSYITSHQKEFRVGSLALKDENYSDLRITVDTVADYTLACIVEDLIRGNSDRFCFRAITECLDTHPYLRNINGDILQKKRYDTLDEELHAAVKLLRLQEMNHAAEVLENQCQVADREE